MNMRAIAGGVAVLLLLGAAIPFGILYSDPVGYGLDLQRRGLVTAGMTPRTVAGEHGDITLWQGGEGPQLVLQHGFMDEPGGWGEVAPELTDHWTVIAPALPGHGSSDAPSNQELTIDETYRGLETALASVDGTFVLVGNSLGGWLSMRYALDHPERVERLVLVNAAGLKHPIPKDLLLPTTREGVERKNRALMGKHAPYVPGFAKDGLIAYFAQPKFHYLYDHLEDDDYLDARLPQMTVPTHLIWGSDDAFFDVPYAMRLGGLIPRSSLDILEGCSHIPQKTCVEDFVEVLDERVKGPPP